MCHKNKGILRTLGLLFLVLTIACGTASKKRALIPGGGADAELKRCLQLSAQKKNTETVNCLEAFKSRYPDSPGAAEADLLIADNYFRKKDYLLASEAYGSFIKEYPYNPKLDYAYYKCGQAYLNQTPKIIDRDQQYLDLAGQYLQRLIEAYPHSPYHSLALKLNQKVRTKQAKKDFAIGKFYYNFNEYRAALPRFAEVVDKYEGTTYDEISFYYTIKALKKLGEKEKARGALNLFATRYPKSRWLKKAK